MKNSIYLEIHRISYLAYAANHIWVHTDRSVHKQMEYRRRFMYVWFDWLRCNNSYEKSKNQIYILNVIAYTQLEIQAIEIAWR